MVEIAKVLAIEERTSAEPVVLLDEPTSVLDARRDRGRSSRRSSGCDSMPRSSSCRTASTRCCACPTGCTCCATARSPARSTRRPRRRRRPAPHDDRPRPATGSHYHEDLHQPPATRGRPAAGAAGCAARRSARRDVRRRARARWSRIAGVQGSGREELCRSLFGAAAVAAGTVAARRRSAPAAITPRTRCAPASATCPPSARSRAWWPRCRWRRTCTLPHTGPRDAPARLLDRAARGRLVDDVDRAAADPHAVRGRPASAACRAATSRRSCSHAGWSPARCGCCCSTTRPAGSTSARKSEVYRLIRELTAIRRGGAAARRQPRGVHRDESTGCWS